MQVERAYRQYCSCTDALAKNTFMTSMKEQNEVLYYKVSILIGVAFYLRYRDADGVLSLHFC